MSKLMKRWMAALAIVGLVSIGGIDAEAKSCVNKAASGTNTTQDGAKFQAWEAVLQATDWGSWASFMSSGAKIGTAPGYAVSKVGTRCSKGGLGYECIMQATLCK
jgi:hypothetical protein